jgi:hypothetical protein
MWESTQYGEQQKKINLYNLPEIMGKKRIPKLPEIFRVPGIFQDAQKFWAEMRNFSSAYIRVPEIIRQNENDQNDQNFKH